MNKMELNYNNDDSLPLENYPSLNELIITNQPINNQYIYILYHKLRELKKERRNKEYETTLLTSRVNCLKQEEERTLKQLEKTKKQTDEKIASIEQQKAKLKQQIKIKHKNKRELDSKKKKNKEQRDSLTEKGLIIKETKKRNIIIEAKMKEQKKANEDYLKCFRNKEIDDKKLNNEKIKGQSMINKERKKAAALEKKSNIKSNLEIKIILERGIKEDNDKKIKQMQIVEEEILNRIQETTQMHKALILSFKRYITETNDNYSNDMQDSGYCLQRESKDNNRQAKQTYYNG